MQREMIQFTAKEILVRAMEQAKRRHAPHTMYLRLKFELLKLENAEGLPQPEQAPEQQ
jgi:hypothetical protein